MTNIDYRQPLFLSGTPRRGAENAGQNPTQKQRLPRVDVEKARTVPLPVPMPMPMPTGPKHTHSCVDWIGTLSLISLVEASFGSPLLSSRLSSSHLAPSPVFRRSSISQQQL